MPPRMSSRRYGSTSLRGEGGACVRGGFSYYVRGALGGLRTLLAQWLQVSCRNMKERISPADISQLVVTEIEAFVVPASHPEQIGEVLPGHWFAQQLEEMSTALVEPYLVEIDGDGRFPGSIPKPVPRQVFIVAEDDDIFLAYDPDPDGDFALIFKSAPGFGVSPIRGQAVDCFMSR